MVCTIHLKYYEILQFNFCCDVWPLQLFINNPVFYYNQLKCRDDVEGWQNESKNKTLMLMICCICLFFVIEYCNVYLRSYSTDTVWPSERHAYININGTYFLKGEYEFIGDCDPPLTTTNNRGVNFMTFDMQTCSANKWMWYDTSETKPSMYGCDERCCGNATLLDWYLSGHVSNGTVLLGINP